MPEKIILASSSPRRKELLSSCFIPFEIVKHKINENSVTNKNPVKLAELLAYYKAESIASQEKYKKHFVLGVDTIVVFQNIVMGKPKNKNEAEKFIRMLSGKKHSVISGISLINKEKSIRLTQNSISHVIFTKIDEIFIKYYLDNNLFKGYSGGYAIQSFFSLVVKKIKGSYSNIVGLPVDVLYKMLKSINYDFLR